MNRKVYSFFLLFLLVILTSSNGHSISFSTVMTISKIHQVSDILGSRVINSSEVYVGNPINLTTIIDNPTTWVLKNISFEIKINEKIVIIEAKNVSNVMSWIKETEEGYLVKVNITKIESSSKGVHWLIIKFREKGNYLIDESIVTFVKQKGELVMRDSITVPAITINVMEPRNPYPKEGTEDVTLPILLFTIILPIIIILGAHKIAWKE